MWMVESDNAHLMLCHPKMSATKVSVVTDTGAQANLFGVSVVHRLRLKKSDLVLVTNWLSTINGEGIIMLGDIFLCLSGSNATNGHCVETACMAYVTDSIVRFYLS